MLPVRQSVIEAIEGSAIQAGIVLNAEQRCLAERLAMLDQPAGRRRRARRNQSSRGLYVHGPAGRGKSWLAQAFFDAAPMPKIRVHFHNFFDELHLRVHDSRDDPRALESALSELLRPSRLLFFDEFHVHDSGDARLLTRLLEFVFAHHFTVLVTSNYSPKSLLPNPIWHHTFEAGIAMIKNHLDVYHLDGPTDYRTQSPHHTTGFASGKWLTASPPGDFPSNDERVTLTVRGREFPVLAVRNDQLWISFAQLCDSPLSTIEYLYWADAFGDWVITDIPLFDEASREAQQRFVNVIDILADTDTPTTFIATHTVADFLATETTRPDAFRMASRLQLLHS
ncbi:cell division protein ZapE [Streptomyces sp. SID6673]|nr:cell division protein ZapE [Streptomyces sp. SID11726]NEB26166.1 cell division protein ZapE [Streptomyces sp. SID6673]